MAVPSAIVTGTLLDLLGNPIVGLTLTFNLKPLNVGYQGPWFISGTTVLTQPPAPVTCTTNASGVYTITLWGNDVISTPGSFYAVSAGNFDGTFQFLQGNAYDLLTAVPITPYQSGGPAIILPTGNQNPNTFYAGPVSGGAQPPTFRAQVIADLPTTGVWPFTGTVSTAVAFTGNPTFPGSPAFSGTVSAACVVSGNPNFIGTPTFGTVSATTVLGNPNFTGIPTFGTVSATTVIGNPAFPGSPTFSGTVSAAAVISANPTFIGNPVFSGSPVFNGTVSAAATISGNPNFIGNPSFPGSPVFSGTVSAAATISGNPNFVGNPTFPGSPVFSGTVSAAAVISGNPSFIGTPVFGTITATTVLGTPNFTGVPTFAAGLSSTAVTIQTIPSGILTVAAAAAPITAAAAANVFVTTLSVPQTPNMSGIPFVLKASGNISCTAGTYTATIQPLIYASTTAGFTASAAAAVYSAAAINVTVTSATLAKVFPWTVTIELEGDTASGLLSGAYHGNTNNGAQQFTDFAIIANAPSSINFAAATPIQFLAGITTTGATLGAGSVVTLNKFFLEV